MNTKVAAYTKLDQTYPGYINFTAQEDGSVRVIVRADPAVIKDASHICGYAVDRGKPGRCTPGDQSCNNYCNMAPEKGPMQPAPLRCTQTYPGVTATLSLSRGELASVLREAISIAES